MFYSCCSCISFRFHFVFVYVAEVIPSFARAPIASNRKHYAQMCACRLLAPAHMWKCAASSVIEIYLMLDTSLQHITTASVAAHYICLHSPQISFMGCHLCMYVFMRFFLHFQLFLFHPSRCVQQCKYQCGDERLESALRTHSFLFSFSCSIVPMPFSISMDHFCDHMLRYGIVKDRRGMHKCVRVCVEKCFAHFKHPNCQMVAGQMQ